MKSTMLITILHPFCSDLMVIKFNTLMQVILIFFARLEVQERLMIKAILASRAETWGSAPWQKDLMK